MDKTDILKFIKTKRHAVISTCGKNQKPEAAAFKSYKNQTYWKIKPTWIRYSDLSGDEDKIYEYKW